jgi:hypothetical protein
VSELPVKKAIEIANVQNNHGCTLISYAEFTNPDLRSLSHDMAAANRCMKAVRRHRVDPQRLAGNLGTRGGFARTAYNIVSR